MKATLRTGSNAFYECMGKWIPCRITAINNGIVSATVSHTIPGLNFEIGEPVVSSIKFNRIFPRLAVDCAGYVHGYDVIED